MPRATYQITAKDALLAGEYLMRHFNSPELLDAMTNKADREEKLQRWVEQNLDAEQTRKMRLSIRQQKRRNARLTETVTLSRTAAEHLRRVAARLEISLSEAVLKLR